jgi:hypothetical protein
MSTKKQANTKHQKKPKRKHKREKANLQSTQIKHVIIKCTKNVTENCQKENATGSSFQHSSPKP